MTITAQQVAMWEREVSTLHVMLSERDAEIERLRAEADEALRDFGRSRYAHEAALARITELLAALRMLAECCDCELANAAIARAEGK